MFSMFLFFIAGAISMRISQFLLSVNPSYRIYKEAESAALKIILETYAERQLSLKVLEILYKEEQEYKLLEKTIKQKYDKLINKSISIIKKNLPYKVKYDTLDEAFKAYVSGVDKNE